MRPRSTSQRVAIAVGLASVLVLSACGGGGTESADATPLTTAPQVDGGEAQTIDASQLPVLTPEEEASPISQDDRDAASEGAPASSADASDGSSSASQDDGAADVSNPTTSTPDTADQPAPTTVEPVSVVIDNRAPTDQLVQEEPEEGVVRNGDGNLVTLDQAGTLACAAAENVLTALEGGSDPSASVAALTTWAAESARVAISGAVDDMDDPVTLAGVVPVLEACVAEGHEL